MQNVLILAAITIVLAALAGIIFARAQFRYGTGSEALPIWGMVTMFTESFLVVYIAVETGTLSSLSRLILLAAVLGLSYLLMRSRLLAGQRTCEHDMVAVGNPIYAAPDSEGLPWQRYRCAKCAQEEIMDWFCLIAFLFSGIVGAFCLGTKFENDMSLAAFPYGIAVFLTSLYGLHFTADLLKPALFIGVILFIAIHMLSRQIPKKWRH